MLLCTAMEDAALLTLEMFEKRLVVLNANLEKLEKLRAPPDAPPTGLLRLPFEIRLYCSCRGLSVTEPLVLLDVRLDTVVLPRLYREHYFYCSRPDGSLTSVVLKINHVFPSTSYRGLESPSSCCCLNSSNS
jgi:hypothetical protein